MLDYLWFGFANLKNLLFSINFAITSRNVRIIFKYGLL